MTSTTVIGTTKYPVICQAEIELELLNTILQDDHLVLVAKTDLSELLTNSVDNTFETPFTGTLPDDIKPMIDFTAAAKAREGISSKAFVILDRQTVEDGKTCQVTTHDDDSDEDNYQDRIPFRCELSSAVAALKDIEQCIDGQERKAARILRNEASITGGVWNQENAARQREKTPRIHPADYRQSNIWDGNSGPKAAEDELPYVPVFRTTDISLETINTFAQETYNQRPEVDPSIAQPTIAFVTSLDHPFHSGSVKPPLATIPSNPSILQGATPMEIDILTRHFFPPQERSQLNYNHFIIMDELTEQTKTVLLVCNCEFEGTELQLLRSDFPSALITVLAPDNTILTMNTLASEAAVANDGVHRLD